MHTNIKTRLALAALCFAPIAAPLPPVRADLIKQGSAYSKTILATDANGANVDTLTTASFTATASKAGAAEVSIPTPPITKIGHGKYAIAVPASLTGTLGALDITLTATGVTQIDSHDQIVGFDPASATVQLPATPPTGYGGAGLTQADYNAIAAALQAAPYLTLPGTATTTGVGETLTYKQWQALLDAVPGGGLTATAPVKGGTATTTYYLRGAAKTPANVVSVSTTTYDSLGNMSGRTVLTAQPFPVLN